jgi:hypothetical protein
MIPWIAQSRDDTSIFRYLVRVADNVEEQPLKAAKALRSFTRPQIRYGLLVASLVIGGATGTIFGDYLPWGWLRTITRELGPGVFTAGILAWLVEPFFRNEFARDAFLSAFRYVLPEEFKEEVQKILANVYVSEKHTWKVGIEKIDEVTVLVTTTFERTIRNRTSSEHKRGGYYTIIEYNYQNGPAQILECAIESEQQQINSFTVKNHGDWLEANTTVELKIAPGKIATLSGKAQQYRRTNDSIWETFTTPIVSPEIEVSIDDEYFGYRVEFGTKGDVQDAKYSHRHTLSAVYFQGQYMHVRWWPKPRIR